MTGSRKPICLPDCEEAALASAVMYEESAHFLATQPIDIFYSGRNRALVKVIKLAIQKHEQLDPVILRECGMSADPPLWTEDPNNRSLPSSAYVLELFDKASGPDQIKAHCKILALVAARRKLFNLTQRVSHQLGGDDFSLDDLPKVTQQIQKAVYEISTADQEQRPQLQHIRPILAAGVEETQAMIERGGDNKAAATGFYDLDSMTGGGIRPGDLWIVAARPSQGKSALALGIALNVAKAGIATVFFSLEMSNTSIVTRIFGREAGIDTVKIRGGNIGGDGLSKLVTVMGDLSEIPLYLGDRGDYTPTSTMIAAREVGITAKKKIGLIVVDYLQLMTPDAKQDSREREVASMTRAFKRIAQNMDCGVVLLSQLNRAIEARPNKRPQLSDLRESGAIEQDADVVIGLFQPYHYDKKPENLGKAEAIILKQRGGPLGVVNLNWHPQTVTFRNAARDVSEFRGSWHDERM